MTTDRYTDQLVTGRRGVDSDKPPEPVSLQWNTQREHKFAGWCVSRSPRARFWLIAISRARGAQNSQSKQNVTIPGRWKTIPQVWPRPPRSILRMLVAARSAGGRRNRRTSAASRRFSVGAETTQRRGRRWIESQAWKDFERVHSADGVDLLLYSRGLYNPVRNASDKSPRKFPLLINRPASVDPRVPTDTLNVPAAPCPAGTSPLSVGRIPGSRWLWGLEGQTTARQLRGAARSREQNAEFIWNCQSSHQGPVRGSWNSRWVCCRNCSIVYQWFRERRHRRPGYTASGTCSQYRPLHSDQSVGCRDPLAQRRRSCPGLNRDRTDGPRRSSVATS